MLPSNHLHSFEKNLFSSLSLSSLTSHTKPKSKDGEIGHRWCSNLRPRLTTLSSCMQAPWFGSDCLLWILSPPPLDQPTHDWSISLSRSTSLFPLIAHSFFLPLSVWSRMMVFKEWFCLEFCFFKFIYWYFIL